MWSSGKPFRLCKLQFPYLQNGNYNAYLKRILRIKTPSLVPSPKQVISIVDGKSSPFRSSKTGSQTYWTVFLRGQALTQGLINDWWDSGREELGISCVTFALTTQSPWIHLLLPLPLKVHLSFLDNRSVTHHAQWIDYCSVAECCEWCSCKVWWKHQVKKETTEVSSRSSMFSHI